MSSRPPLARFVIRAALAASALLIVVLAQSRREISRAYAELRLRSAVLYQGDVVPTFHTVTLDGVPVTIGAASSPEARQVLFILRTTCPYCRATIPVWRWIADSLRRVVNPRVEVFAISLDSAEPTRVFARTYGLAYPLLLFPEQKLERLYRVAATPQTLVLNAEGRVLYARTGLLDSAAALDSVFRAATAHGRRDARSLPVGRKGLGPGD